LYVLFLSWDLVVFVAIAACERNWFMWICCVLKESSVNQTWVCWVFYNLFASKLFLFFQKMKKVSLYPTFVDPWMWLKVSRYSKSQYPSFVKRKTIMWQWYFSWLNHELTDPYVGVLEASGNGENELEKTWVNFIFYFLIKKKRVKSYLSLAQLVNR
jgi:hypothetical protein